MWWMEKAVLGENFFQIVIVRGARQRTHQYHRSPEDKVWDILEEKMVLFEVRVEVRGSRVEARFDV